MQIMQNYDIKQKSFFKIGGVVKHVAIPDTVAEFICLLQTNEYDYIIGNCSNILFDSGYIDKNFILTTNLNKFSFNDNTIYAQCGVGVPVLSHHCADRGLSGFEFAIGIPGTIGGMICMNAGAHNSAISNILKSARIFNRNIQKIESVNKEQFNFEYRNSNVLKNKWVIIDAEFELQPIVPQIVHQKNMQNIQERRAKQIASKNLGCVFKNPPSDYAGRLLDKCNMRGQSIGGAKISDIHANFILNYDNATSADVIQLMYKMYTVVKDKYGITLQPEIKYIGNEQTSEFQLWQQMMNITR